MGLLVSIIIILVAASTVVACMVVILREPHRHEEWYIPDTGETKEPPQLPGDKDNPPNINVEA
jgi:hypothetical protein